MVLLLSLTLSCENLEISKEHNCLGLFMTDHKSFFSHFEEICHHIARCASWFVSSQTAGTANLMGALRPLNNEVQGAPVTKYEVLFGNRMPSFQ